MGNQDARVVFPVAVQSLRQDRGSTQAAVEEGTARSLPPEVDDQENDRDAQSRGQEFLNEDGHEDDQEDDPETLEDRHEVGGLEGA